ncbi:bacillithiol system redox-active protein YtxJ [Flagellimonas nanhaiensis]|uniref:Bacillithiol system redox-active protein YtxJ n=1 Tax=Flagellimonas nanhaiensis TaxID=2292706 RepID=A0A371JU83_9FLAO|nr:bacillithiol system redox-active protein YtxJ [Allomuricauda nanhaiensis]RDY61346.1 bacillithiol system redox-active protein YtxJ [Allomuricauda nanhaiensis]
MGIFNSLFGGKKEVKEEKESLPWIPLVSVDQLEEIVDHSKSRTQLIFKHSTTCGISNMVLRMFSDHYTVGEDADLYYLDLHAHRDVSNAVASQFQVLHQSPQLLIIKDGEAAFHASHGAITDADLENYI